ncbi:MAG: hypothetical protein O7C67_00715 [Gammaproteobacteria bacterium]|nr:hypothetical protein [Gammaproteobacteria bacterium]
MIRLPLAPYFHPTTVCFVDDNESFLRSLDLQLPVGWAYKSFTDPLIALDFLQQPAALPPLVDRCFSIDHGDRLEPTVHLDLGMVEQEIHHIERFARISVVIVDYAMPSLNGLDFCAALDDPYLKKALLTGVADEKVAVEAFNDGLIHKFIPKNTAIAIDTILTYVTDLQHQYFNQYISRLHNTLSIDPPGFLVDSNVQSHILDIMIKEQIVEYYLVNDPPGFLLVRSDGTMKRLVILNETQMQFQEQELRQLGAPADIVANQAARKVVGFFAESPVDYLGHEPYPWAENLIDATHIAANEDWFVGLVDDPPRDIDFDPAKSSYDAYLASLE